MLDVATCSRSSVILSFFILYINPPPQSPSNYIHSENSGVKKQMKKPKKEKQRHIFCFENYTAYCEKKKSNDE